MAPHLRPLPNRDRTLPIDSTTAKTAKRGGRTRKIKEDRLSDLPDAVLCHILSFLDTKYAVATSVLSKRWKHLSVLVPNIILDDSLTGKTSNEGCHKEFAMFGLKQIMLRNVPHINKFHLKCKHNLSFKDPFIKTLVNAAIWRNVREFDILLGEIEHGTLGSLPTEIFTATSLVVLKLEGQFVSVDFPEMVTLPNLKVMHLDGLRFESNDSVWSLFHGCMFLEDLCLYSCVFWEVDTLHLSFPFLRKFSYKEEDVDSCFFRSITGTRFLIDTPKLELFEYQGHIPKSLSMKMLTSYCRAEIFSCLLGCTDHENNTCEFINNLRGFKSIYLSEDTVEAMYPDCSLTSASEASVFETLSFLEVAAYGIQIIPRILERAPQLEVLVIHKHGHAFSSPFSPPFSLPETVPICLVKHLKIVEFKDFHGLEEVFKLLKYILRNGSVLERIKIVKQYDYRGWIALRKKIMRFPRCSKTCKFVFEYCPEN